MGKTLHGIRRQCRPRLAEVRRLVDIRLLVTESVPVKRHVGRGPVVAAGLDRTDPRRFRNSGEIRSHVCPRPSAVERHLDIAVIGPGPHDARVLRRLADRENCAVVLGARIIGRKTSRILLLQLRRVVRGQVGTDALPRSSTVARPEQELGSDINRSGSARAQLDRSVPVVAVPGFAGLRLGSDGLPLVGRPVEPRYLATLILDKNRVAIRRIREGIEPVANSDVVPVGILDAVDAARWPGPRPVILKSAVHRIRLTEIMRHVVELGNGKAADHVPLVPVVLRSIHTSVRSHEKPRRVVRIDPQTMDVAVIRAAGP